MVLALAATFGGQPGVQAWAADHRVSLEARVGTKTEPLKTGVIWRVYRAVNGKSGEVLVGVAEAQGGPARFDLPSGSYYLHASYGRAVRTERLIVEGDTHRAVVLGAGALMLDATAGGQAIAPDLLRFDIYEHRRRDDGKRRIVAFNVRPSEVTRLNAGTYHVLSRYGRLRTEVRADLVVRSGETTRAVMQHRGAEVRLKLASAPGGIPIANTAWSIFSEQGEKLYESARNAPRIVLPEGGYEAVARNGETTLKRSFAVRPGTPVDLELLLP